MAYARPVLCRLCGFPAQDGGVPVSEVDREKLSEWCLRMMDTELDEEGLEKAVLCLFCVADVKFEHQFSVDSGDEVSGHSQSVLWKKVANASFVEKFVFEDAIQPCFVDMECMSEKQIDKLSRGITTHSKVKDGRQKNVYKCQYCPVEFVSRFKLKNHATQTHKDKPIFPCQTCLKIFNSSAEKIDHFKTDHKDKSVCIYCGAQFEYANQTRLHIEKHHKGAEIQCKYTNKCTLYFKTEAQREEHVQKVHKSGATKCVYCEKFFLGNTLSEHIKKHHRLEAIRCDYLTCKTYFLSQEEKEKHCQKFHSLKEGKFRCVYCNRVLAKASCLKKHIKSYHPSDAIRCNFNKMCPTYFLTEEDRQRHIQDVHETKPLITQHCIYCNRNCPDYRTLQLHINSAHSEVKIKCNWFRCRRYFHTASQLDEHCKQEHAAKDDLKDTTFQCQKCCYKTCLEKRLKRHILTQHSDENLQCSQCTKVFKSQVLLTSHMRQVHKHSTELECRFCLKSFKNLMYHLRKRKCLNCDVVSHCLRQSLQHQKTCAKKLKKCEFCPEAFKTKKELDSHILKQHVQAPVVMSGKLYYCRFCWKKYASRKNLDNHIKSPQHLKNIQGAPFTCDFCQKQFVSLVTISNHVRRSHLEDFLCLSCTKCGLTFSSRRKLKMHSLYAHSEQKYIECTLCNATVRDVSLRLHRFNVHRIFER